MDPKTITISIATVLCPEKRHLEEDILSISTGRMSRLPYGDGVLDSEVRLE